MIRTLTAWRNDRAARTPGATAIGALACCSALALPLARCRPPRRGGARAAALAASR